MDEISQPILGTTAQPNRGWPILAVSIAALIGVFLMWLAVTLLASVGNVVGGAFAPMSRSSLSDAQTFYVLLAYLFSIVSFATGLFVLLLSTRRLLAR